MRHIFRRYITHDAFGAPLTKRTERLRDDENGNLRLSERQLARRCSGCLRHTLDLAELRGVCDSCGIRQCCVHCVSRCGICSRQLCGQCRTGFVGDRQFTVCATCNRGLLNRQRLTDQLNLEQHTFDCWLARQRLLHQAEALRLNERRLQLAEQSQAAKLGTNRRTPLQIAVSIVRFTGGKVFSYVQRALR